MRAKDGIGRRPLTDDRLSALDRIAQATPGLELLMVYGSRARGDDTPRSDWDFGYLAAAGSDVAGLLAALVTSLDTDRVDLVDLSRASGLLRFRAARDGVVIFESTDGVADRFRLEAVTFWCDAEPVLQRGHEDVLARLDR